MASGPAPIVDVLPGCALAERSRLFEALHAASGATFQPQQEGGLPADAAIRFVADGEVCTRAAGTSPRRPTLVLEGSPRRDPVREPVEMTGDPRLDRRLRGIELRDELPRSLAEVDGGVAVLAQSERGPIWTASSDPAPEHRVRAALTELDRGQTLWSVLSQRPIALIATLQFLRSLTAESGWRPPPLRATFMFDDPNLRWRSYGFIDYRRLLRHADEHGYHAAMALIPLDAGRAHGPTASMFASRPDRLSLLVHGNDHVRQELEASADLERAVVIAAQARRRIEAFERRYGLTVARVMAPPHGACSPHMTRALGIVGFDALSGALPSLEGEPADHPLSRWRPADFVGGLPVIPRIPLSSSVASIALRAFLDHPLILYGHHRDLADGLEPLEALSAIVNRLGDVRWLSMGEIAATNVETRVEGDTMWIRPFSRRIELQPTAGIRSLRVQAPEDLLPLGELSGWSLPGGAAMQFSGRADIPAGAEHRLVLHGSRDVDPAKVPAPHWRAAPKLRRFAVEARDRAMPLACAAGLVR